MKKVRRLLRSNQGSMSFFTVAVILCMLITITGIFEWNRLHIIADGTYDAVQRAVTTACTENYDHLYNGVREGYSGGYHLSDGEWQEDVDEGEVYAKLDSLLGTKAEGDEHIKYSGEQMEFSLSDLDVQMTNTPFAPDDSEHIKQFTGVAYVTLKVPLSFGWNALPPMQIPMKVTAGYMAKF